MLYLQTDLLKKNMLNEMNENTLRSDSLVKFIKEGQL